MTIAITGDARRKVLGGTDISAIVGLNPWRTAHDVWMEKLGLATTSIDPEIAEMGKLLEVPIGRKYSRVTGWKLRRPNPENPRFPCFMRSTDPEKSWFGGSPDYFVVDQPRLMDCKTARIADHVKWGEEGTDAIPHQYLIQAHWYLALTELGFCDIATLFGVHDFRIYTVPRDKDLEGILLERGEKFWKDHILTKTPPAVDYSEGAARMLATLHPEHDEALLIADAADEELARQLKTTKQAISLAYRESDLLENKFKETIGDHAGIQGDGWKITWKRSRDSESVDWEAVARDLAISDTVLEAAVREHKSIRPGSRRFLPDRNYFSTKEILA
jgi:putative phage-type endonuclease